MSSNPNQLCRLCFMKKDECFNIFTDTKSRLNIANTIDKYCPCEKNGENLFPNAVCTECWSKVESFHEFHNRVVLARNNYLKSQREYHNSLELSMDEYDVDYELKLVESDTYSDDQPLSTLITPDEPNYVTRKENAVNDIETSPTEDSFAIGADAETDASESNDKLLHKRDIFIPDYFDNSCDKCPVRFDSFQQAYSHYLREHGVRKGYVKCCGAKFSDVGRINDHIKWHKHNDLNTFRCRTCQSTFKTKNALTSHENIHEGFICNICNKVLSSQYHLTGHLINVHNLGPQFQCEICKVKLFTKSLLQAHMNETHRKRNNAIPLDLMDEADIPEYFDMSCDDCPLQFQSFKHAEVHYLDEHKRKRGYLKCCGSKLIGWTKVKEHIELHSNPNLFR